MSEPPTVVVQQNGGNAGRLIEASRSILSVVPPSFLGLCLVNLLFLGAVLWFLDAQVDARMQLVGKIVDACVVRVQH